MQVCEVQNVHTILVRISKNYKTWINMNILQVGDVVMPDDGDVLRSGSSWYDHAVVISIDPLVLVSIEGDMRWESTIKDRHFSVIGVASPTILRNALERIHN
jgi:hypothetical protein